MEQTSEDRIVALLRLLAPAPEGLVAVACEIPGRERSRGRSEVPGSSPGCEEERDG